jgi:serine protease Do
MYDGSKYDATLVGEDASNDIAVLKIEAQNLTPVVLGSSDSLKVGEDVVAIGNPLGELHFSLTRGVVSALDRNVTFSGNMHLKLIQTDCAINSGNSGGALFNMYGEVIGITNAKMSGSGFGATVDNIAFAIPVNTVVGIVDQIMTKGEISKPYIGVTVTPVKEDLLAYGIPRGAEIVSVNEDSPAEEAGLQEKDIIIEANGEEVKSSDDLVKIVSACEHGEKLELTVYRAGEKVDITVTVGENVKSALPETEEDQKESE